jgi:hypothetical protein
MMKSCNRLLTRNVTALLLALSLSSCAGPQIHHGQLSLLDKGLQPNQVISRLQLEPLSTHAANSGGRMFEFQRYRLNNGIQQDVYFLAYEDQRLAYWGYISEFRRQQDMGLASALDKVLGQHSGRQ